MRPNDVDVAAFGPVLRVCLFCRTRFPRNEIVPSLGVGRRVAFDPHHGRLWVVCSACDAWNLVPLEARWEALEELERVTSSRGARLLMQTANIALLELDAMHIVRVGTSSLPEEVWWRYGAVLRQRRKRADDARSWGRIINALISAAVIGLPLPNWRDAEWNVERARRKLYGYDAWPGALRCSRCGGMQQGIRFEERGDLKLVRDAHGRSALWSHCHRCGRAARDAGLLLHDAAAEHVLRRVLAYTHFAGAPDRQLERASALVSDAGTGAALEGLLADEGRFLVQLQQHESLALEIATNEARERSLLSLEVAALESRWQEEERIAAIVDGELS